MKSIPCMIMRGGTSKGPFFLLSDLPSDEKERNLVLMQCMGSPHPMQIDGLGGAQPQTSKAAIVSPSDREDADVEYLFAQIGVDRALVDTSPNCGNMITAVGPFAIEKGLVKPAEGITKIRIFNRNTQSLIETEVMTRPDGVVYEGDHEIDGVAGKGAPVFLNFANGEGAKTGELLPTGKVSEEINGVRVSLVDYSMPMMLLSAESVGLDGSESPAEVEAGKDRMKRIEAMRRIAGERMGFGDVADSVIPKVGILSKPRFGGSLTGRYLTPLKCHKAHAITGGMCVAAAGYLAGSVVCETLGKVYEGDQDFELEHPQGALSLRVKANPESGKILTISTVRTARKIMEGTLFLPQRNC